MTTNTLGIAGPCRWEMRLFVRLWLTGAVLVWGMAVWRSESLPPPPQLEAALRKEPRQSATSREPFAVTVGAITYRLEPLYEYELDGLVVSENDTAPWWTRSNLHRRVNDFLNVKDVCVVWGANAASGVYRQLRFSSGEFTCYARPRSAAAAAAFDPTALSNNHLLAADEELRRVLRSVRRGDQIHLRGYLAAYSHDHGLPFRRGSSTRRDDTGNGACETLYVSDARIVRPGNPLWRQLARLAPVGLLVGVIGWLRLPVPQR